MWLRILFSPFRFSLTHGCTVVMDRWYCSWFRPHALCICARTDMAQGGKPIGLIVWMGVRLSLIRARDHARDPEERDNTRGCVTAGDLPVFFFLLSYVRLVSVRNCHVSQPGWTANEPISWRGDPPALEI